MRDFRGERYSVAQGTDLKILVQTNSPRRYPLNRDIRNQTALHGNLPAPIGVCSLRALGVCSSLADGSALRITGRASHSPVLVIRRRVVACVCRIQLRCMSGVHVSGVFGKLPPAPPLRESDSGGSCPNQNQSVARRPQLYISHAAPFRADRPVRPPEMSRDLSGADPTRVPPGSGGACGRSLTRRGASSVRGVLCPVAFTPAALGRGARHARGVRVHLLHRSRSADEHVGEPPRAAPPEDSGALAPPQARARAPTPTWRSSWALGLILRPLWLQAGVLSRHVMAPALLLLQGSVGFHQVYVRAARRTCLRRIRPNSGRCRPSVRLLFGRMQAQFDRVLLRLGQLGTVRPNDAQRDHNLARIDHFGLEPAEITHGSVQMLYGSTTFNSMRSNRCALRPKMSPLLTEPSSKLSRRAPSLAEVCLDVAEPQPVARVVRHRRSLRSPAPRRGPNRTSRSNSAKKSLCVYH